MLGLFRRVSSHIMENLDKFGRKLPERQGGYLVPSLTTDSVVFRNRPDGFHDILLITRLKDPFQGHLAFPGGFVDYNEDPKSGCLRELKEECGIDGISLKLLDVAGDPIRDPRGHTVSIIYRVEVADDAQVVAGDDAATAQFYPVREIVDNIQNLAFDHGAILLSALRKEQMAQLYGLD